MLEHLPQTVGHLLKNVRPGLEKVIYYDNFFKYVPETITLNSPAFTEGGTIPIEYTSDGERISPPLQWHGIPDNAHSLVLIVEDADSPTLAPLTHALITGLPAVDDEIPEASFRNFGARYLSPDPPPGHGPHRYVFQLFALDTVLHFSGIATKHAVKDAMYGKVLAKGCLLGIYERSKNNDLKNGYSGFLNNIFLAVC